LVHYPLIVFQERTEPLLSAKAAKKGSIRPEMPHLPHVHPWMTCLQAGG